MVQGTPHERPHMGKATVPQVSERRTVLEFLESHSDAALRSQDAGWILLYLRLLRDKDTSVYTRWQVAKNELQATERLQRLAMKHEDLDFADELGNKLDYLRDIIPQYAALWQRIETQGQRLWEMLEERAGVREPA